MAKLITDHDPYHIHKILGVLTLLHYIYRFALLVQYGTAFPNLEESSSAKYEAAAGVFLHGLLSWSSLLLPLPTKRNFTKPMIWPEFRLHSISFASRHIVTTIITLLDLWPKESNLLQHTLARAVVLCGTVHAASRISDKYGDPERRTTNAMPYPSTVDEQTQQPRIKKQYALSQFAATSVCLLNDPSLNFAPLLAIQMAPLMMTLVRKGKATSFDYHRIYAVSLYMGYVMVFVRLLTIQQLDDNNEDANALDKTIGLKALFLLNIPHSKLRRFTTSMNLAAMSVLSSTILYPLLVQHWLDTAISSHVANMIFWFVTIAASGKQVMTYAPLFGISFHINKNETTTQKKAA